ncbi:hypothetical protein EVAR_11847_1 [Eumeta japonica]|uniref:Uncharacterized protein n=1 Tax=Eumeta variegata TaxID=151549 RepID=A0A4C1SF23_EUMVA|nr:hypothetical protein EVAR_11847_1 [Eumeta japonica]
MTSQVSRLTRFKYLCMEGIKNQSLLKTHQVAGSVLVRVQEAATEKTQINARPGSQVAAQRDELFSASSRLIAAKRIGSMARRAARYLHYSCSERRRDVRVGNKDWEEGGEDDMA